MVFSIVTRLAQEATLALLLMLVAIAAVAKTLAARIARIRALVVMRAHVPAKIAYARVRPRAHGTSQARHINSKWSNGGLGDGNRIRPRTLLSTRAFLNDRGRLWPCARPEVRRQKDAWFVAESGP